MINATSVVARFYAYSIVSMYGPQGDMDGEYTRWEVGSGELLARCGRYGLDPFAVIEHAFVTNLSHQAIPPLFHLPVQRDLAMYRNRRTSLDDRLRFEAGLAAMRQQIETHADSHEISMEIAAADMLENGQLEPLVAGCLYPALQTTLSKQTRREQLRRYSIQWFVYREVFGPVHIPTFLKAYDGAIETCYRPTH